MKRILLFLLLVPSAAFAEVSDKMPSITSIFIQGTAIAAILFVVGKFRWWLGVLFSPVVILFVISAISLWNEVGMRETLLKEQGWLYFGALLFQCIVIGVGTTIGSILGYRKHTPNKALNSQPPAAGTPQSGAH